MPGTGEPPTLRALQFKLKEILTMFNDIILFVKNYKDGTGAIQIQVRLSKVDELWKMFSDTLVEILSHKDYGADADKYAKERQQFSSEYYDVKAFLLEKLECIQQAAATRSTNAHDSSTSSISDHVRLPQIKLQTFKGDLDEWISFRDLFTSLIHSRTDLPDVEKLHYLKGCLLGEPKGLIDPLAITAANYHVAWNLITKRYDNSKQLRKRQVQSLFSLPHIAKESVSELQVLVEGFERIVQTLDQVVEEAGYKDLLLVNMLSSRLDPVTHRSWEEQSSTKDEDTVKELLEFLHRRIQVLTSIPIRSAESRVESIPRQKGQMVKASYSSKESTSSNCVCCTENHYLYTCPVFQTLTVREREAVLRKHLLCRNCFRVGHQGKDCRSKYSCRTCRGRHHTLICFNSNPDSTLTVDNNSSSPEDADASTSTTDAVANMATSETLEEVSTCSTVSRRSSKVFLATAVILVEDSEGNTYPVRTLLDSGSECNFISEGFCQLLKVVRTKVDIKVQGIGQKSTRVKHQIQVKVRSRVSEFVQSVDFLVLPKATVNIPTTTVDASGWSIPQDINLADPGFFKATGVEMVLGIELFFSLFDTEHKIPLGNNMPTLVSSVFGWVVCGTFSIPKAITQVNCYLSVLDRLEDLRTRFEEYKGDEAPVNSSPDGTFSKDQYQHTVQSADDGRYIVTLSKNEDMLKRMSESRDIALQRFYSTEHRLTKDGNLGQHVEFILGYQQEIMKASGFHLRKLESKRRKALEQTSRENLAILNTRMVCLDSNFLVTTWVWMQDEGGGKLDLDDLAPSMVGQDFWRLVEIRFYH